MAEKLTYTRALLIDPSTGQGYAATGVGAFSGACTIADGADVTLGAKADARNAATDTTAISEISILKELSYLLQQVQPTPLLSVGWADSTKKNAKNAAGVALSVIVTNINAAIRYFQIHNKATAPAGGDVPVISIPIPAGTATVPGQLLLERGFFGFAGLPLSTGVGWAISTTIATFTDSATTTDHTVHLEYA